MLDTLDAAAIRRWSVAAAEILDAHRGEIDDLNVFPVPDGDTGTNLALTWRAAADALDSTSALDSTGASARAAARARTTPTPATQALQMMARGAVLGARGNSGVIMSQILRGLAESAGATPAESLALDAQQLARALRRAADCAYEAVSQPIEGTILSVMRAAEKAAGAVAKGVEGVPGPSLIDVIRAAQTAATIALAQTPEQLPALARAGVVDAGGRGLVLVIQALASVIAGAPGAAPPPVSRVARSYDALSVARESGSNEFAYEVQYLLEAEIDAVALLRSQLSKLGDSLVVVGTGDGIWNVHVHVNDVGAAIEAGIENGRPYRITVTRFADDATKSSELELPPPRIRATAIVAVAPGEGLAHLFTAEGVVVVDGGPTANPSTADVLAAVRASGATHIVLLPNASQIASVAEVAARLARAEGIKVTVVPTRSPVQGLAAVAVHDNQRHFNDDVVAMAEAAAATRWAEVTVAQRDSLTSVGPCQPGDILGLIDGEVVVIGVSVVQVATTVIDRLVGIGAELITIVVGHDADNADVTQLQAHLHATASLVDVAVFHGGQPHYPFLIGAE